MEQVHRLLEEYLHRRLVAPFFISPSLAGGRHSVSGPWELD